MKTLSLTENNLLLAGSWDSTCTTYFYDAGQKTYVLDKTLAYHTGAVYSSCARYPNYQSHNHRIDSKGFFTGGQDHKIYGIDLVGNPLRIYEGHSNSVNSLSQADVTELVSGSWDG